MVNGLAITKQKEHQTVVLFSSILDYPPKDYLSKRRRDQIYNSI